MKITNVKVDIVSIPFVRPFAMAMWTSTEKIHVIVRIYTDEGIIGVGETVPLVAELGEPAKGVKNVIEEYLAPAIIGSNPYDVEEIFEKMEKVVKYHLFAKSAIDFALYDLLGKISKVPTYKFLGGKFREKVPLTWVIGIKEPEQVEKEAVKYANEGYQVLKLKAGKDFEVTLKSLQKIRDAVGYRIGIRIDANQAWVPSEAIKIIRKMERYQLELIEQPVAYWDFYGMARVRKAVDTPIMVDEAVRTSHDALRIIEVRAADLINLKIAKMGGIFYSKRIAQIAEAAGMDCVVGSMLEGTIGTAAGAHFALATGVVTHTSDLIGPLHHKDDVARGGLIYEDGYLKVPEKVGLGFELEEEKLEKYRL